ncbi:MAG: SusD/RagB family nutrient-binding outer membrane lipoprotein [Agriterribacter sp.]
MKHFKLYICIAVFVSVILPSCTKNFVEKNTDPNLIDRVVPEVLLPGIIRSTVNQMVNESWGIGNIVIQHTAKVQFVSEDRYIWGNRDGLWNNMYANLRDVQRLIALSEQTNASNYKAIAMIMKAWMYSLLTDAYGDVPYSEATQGELGTYQPKYDSQESIYEGILAELKSASDLLGTTGEAVSGDLIYGGNISKWKKLANSLRIRYLMRISNKKDVKAELQAIIDNPGTYPIFEEANKNADNGTLRYLPSAPNQFPLYTTRSGSFDEFRLSRTLETKLKAFGDNRLEVFGQPTVASVNAGNPQYVGVPNGLNEVDALTYNGGPNNVSKVGDLYYQGSITATGLNVAVGYIMGYPELQFLLAEAVKKNMVTTGETAQWHYEEGIKASFDYFSTEMPAGYLTHAGVQYSDTDALTLIGTQKWIALFFTGLEAWFDWRRTNIPEIIPGPGNQNNNVVPVRFAYPTSEQSLNPSSRTAALSAQGWSEDTYNQKVWWDQ